MRFLGSFLLTLALSTLAHTKEAEAGIEHPLSRGLVVGGITALSVAGGGALGYAGGDALGDDGWSSFGLGFMGGTLTAAVAAPLGALFVSDYAGANKNIVTRNTAIVTALGAACTFTGMFTINEGLLFAGVGTILVAAPLTASISAGLFPGENLYSLAPVITPTFHGFAFHSRF